MKIALIGTTGFVASAILKERIAARPWGAGDRSAHGETHLRSGTVSRWVIDERQTLPRSPHHAL